MRSNLYEIRFSGSYLGGKAIVIAISKESAWSALKKSYPSLEGLDKCRIKELPKRDGVIYLDDGEY